MNEREEHFATDPSLAALDREVAAALAVEAPTDLAERIYRATVDRLPGDPLQRQVAAALAVEAPTDLAERIYRATVDRLPDGSAGHDRPQPTVIGRIGLRRISRWVAAAVILISVGLSIWMVRGLETVNPQSRATAMIGPAELNALEMALTGQATTIEADLATLSMDVQNLAATLYQPPMETAVDAADNTRFDKGDLMTDDLVTWEF